MSRTAYRHRARGKQFLLVGIAVIVGLYFIGFVGSCTRAYLKTYREETHDIGEKEHEYEPAEWERDPFDGELEMTNPGVNNYGVELEGIGRITTKQSIYESIKEGETYCFGVYGFDGNSPTLAKVVNQGPCLADIKSRRAAHK